MSIARAEVQSSDHEVSSSSGKAAHPIRYDSIDVLFGERGAEEADIINFAFKEKVESIVLTCTNMEDFHFYSPIGRILVGCGIRGRENAIDIEAFRLGDTVVADGKVSPSIRQYGACRKCIPPGIPVARPEIPVASVIVINDKSVG